MSRSLPVCVRWRVCRRLCHDGSLYEGFEGAQRRRTFTIFDRIRHIKPREDADGRPSSTLCTSDQVPWPLSP